MNVQLGVAKPNAKAGTPPFRQLNGKVDLLFRHLATLWKTLLAQQHGGKNRESGDVVGPSVFDSSTETFSKLLRDLFRVASVLACKTY